MHVVQHLVSAQLHAASWTTLRILRARDRVLMMGRSTRRGPWLPEEDTTLLQLVHIQGPNNWVRISQHMQHRSPKQCRERYHQNLKPSLNHEPVSPEEGEIIEQLVQDMGKRWAEIARRLGNRSDNAVKNWWNGSMNRRKRSNMPSNGAQRLVGPRSQPISAGGMHARESYYGQRAQSTHHHFLLTSAERQQEVLQPGLYDRGHSASPPVRQQRNTTSFQQPAAFSHTQLPPLEVRELSRLNHSYSAPSSAQGNPCETLTSHLHPTHASHTQRPNALESRHSYHAEWNLPRIHSIDGPAISPAATDNSVSASLQQAPPSLISDNQSHYSISPRTISSPRPGMPAPIDTSSYYWGGSQRPGDYNALPTPGKAFRGDEGYVSALPPPSTLEPAHQSFPLDPLLKRTNSQPLNTISPEHYSRALPSPTERDRRMNLSSLLK